MSNMVVSKVAASTFEKWNRESAIKHTHHREKMLAILKLHGMPIQTYDGVIPMQTFEVHLFQHQVAAIYRIEERNVWILQEARTTGKTQKEEVSQKLDEIEKNRIISLAIRTIYALGLDYGKVLVGVHSPTRMRVLDCKAELPADVLLRERLQLFMKEREQQILLDQVAAPQVMLGADPEFALRDQSGNMAIASEYLPKNGVIGYDGVRLKTELLSHQHPLVEVRPEPSTEPETVFKNIYRALHLAQRRISDDSIIWLAGGMPFDGYPIGGHVHVSGTTLHFDLMRKLDTYLALPLCLLEDQGCMKRRPRYGFLGDVRAQAHGGFEYRTLPSWLVSPRITKGVLALTKVIAESQYLLKQDVSTDISMQLAYYRGEKEKLASLVKDLYLEINNLPLFQTYRKYITPFFHSIFMDGEWPCNQDMKLTWKLPPFQLNNH
ncbi:putative amidoligase domain-containing protein [Brevibacillus laterosporus]|uniref:putative amidoligase domain-containing protein n=1 Tax=Brevibacillus laterosporus TaxID=1465 RepID=UPI000EAD2220|nr:hypothetical protein [Brevibacillus laterosporus]AYK08769.1 hypothetical protein D8Z77_21855 [Brevibacillus laterosporus]MDF9410997.1 hypothetical protein [Brevibacillus laterosporus]